MKFKIHRLCRDKETILRLKEHKRKYSLPESVYYQGIDLYSFINRVIKESSEDYALICHDDVILPENIEENVNQCVKSANKCFGKATWGVIGNAGVHIISKQVSTYISDPHTKHLPPRTESPEIVESVDGNTILINVKNLRDKNVELPSNLSGFHLYDLILCLESYKKGLICAVSSWLYVIHSSPGSYNSFLSATREEQFQNYFIENFTNHIVTTINGEININGNFDYLTGKARGMVSIEDTIMKTIRSVFSEKEFELHILTRLHLSSKKIYRLLDSVRIFNNSLPKQVKLTLHLGLNNISNEKIKPFVNKIKKDYSDINIKESYIKGTHKYSRVSALNELLLQVDPKDNSYVWIIDYDDFIMPVFAKDIQYLLANTKILIGDSIIFDEEWEQDSKYPISSTYRYFCSNMDIGILYSGINTTPICSVIYNSIVIKEVFEENSLQGDYFEDYAILLLSSMKVAFKGFPVKIAGISYHGSNTVLEKDRTHWDYSYATFISEVINKGLMDRNHLNILNRITSETNRLRSIEAEYEGFKMGIIWRLLTKYRGLKKLLQKLI